MAMSKAQSNPFAGGGKSGKGKPNPFGAKPGANAAGKGKPTKGPKKGTGKR